MRFKLKEGTQRTSLRVILSLNLIVPIDEMGAVEPVGKLTIGINDDEVCVWKIVSQMQNDWLLPRTTLKCESSSEALELGA